MLAWWNGFIILAIQINPRIQSFYYVKYLEIKFHAKSSFPIYLIHLTSIFLNYYSITNLFSIIFKPNLYFSLHSTIPRMWTIVHKATSNRRAYPVATNSRHRSRAPRRAKGQKEAATDRRKEDPSPSSSASGCLEPRSRMQIHKFMSEVTTGDATLASVPRWAASRGNRIHEPTR